MTQLTIQLPERSLADLKAKAARRGISAEELGRIAVEEMLSLSEKSFEEALAVVLKQDHELHRRLAR